MQNEYYLKDPPLKSNLTIKLRLVLHILIIIWLTRTKELNSYYDPQVLSLGIRSISGSWPLNVFNIHTL